MKIPVTLAFLAFVSSAWASAVLELTDDSFDTELENHETALVMFYAPWCGHCKRLKPEFDEASKTLSVNDPPVALAKVDCTEAGKAACGRFDVRGYPTLKIFRNGELSADYNGPRDVSGIIKYMRSQVGPATREIETEADLKALLEKAEDVVVVSFADAGTADAAEFSKTADSMRETVNFAHSKLGALGGKSGIVLFRPKALQTKLEDSEVVFDGKVSRDNLKAWIKESYHGLVGVRTVDNARDFTGNLVVAYYDVDYVKNPKGTNYWRNRVMKVAKKFPGLKFAVSNLNDFMQELQEYGLSGVGNDKPMVAVKADKKYVMDDEFSMESFEQFLNDYQAGKIEAYLKSEPVPASQGNVKVAVGKNWDDLVANAGKDALVEFYAPWCGHCKKLTPIYEELGEKMADEDVLIVKMDATANDVPAGFDVRGFPTIFWVPKGGEPKAYQGGREVDEFVKFIAAEATTELKGFDRKGNAKKTEL